MNIQLIDQALQAAKDIYTWTEHETLFYLATLANRSSTAVEIGTYMGASAKVMAVAAPHMHLWCVDKFMVAGTEKVTRYFLRDEIARGQVELIIGDSERAASMLQHMRGKLDLVWVDDGHAEEDLLRDIGSFWPLLRRGGIMVGHDFEQPHNDVARGVIRSGINYSLPLPRLWQAIKP